MAFQLIAPNVYQLNDSGVNVFLVDCQGLTLIDTGHHTSGEKIISGLRELGHDPCSLSRILLTHCHPDHAGSAAQLQEELGAQILCHPIEAKLLGQGETNTQALKASPGLLNKLLFQAFVAGAPSEVKACEVDRVLEEGEEAIGGFQVVHTPGHSAGHLAFLWNGTLFAGDAAANMGWLRPPIVCENYEQTLHSIQKLTRLDFHLACFGHGAAILDRAANRFRRRTWFEASPRVDSETHIIWRRED